MFSGRASVDLLRRLVATRSIGTMTVLNFQQSALVDRMILLYFPLLSRILAAHPKVYIYLVQEWICSERESLRILADSLIIIFAYVIALWWPIILNLLYRFASE